MNGVRIVELYSLGISRRRLNRMTTGNVLVDIQITYMFCEPSGCTEHIAVNIKTSMALSIPKSYVIIMKSNPRAVP